MKLIKKNWQKLFLVLCLFLLPFISSAQNTDVDPVAKLQDPLNGKFGSIPALIQAFLEGMIRIGIPVVALAIIYSGFLFVFARGNTEKLGKAKTTLMYTLIGAAILFGAWAIAKLISETVLAL